jgi:putative tryptophan/tyrosine transport system substrate-binding protein
MSTRREFITLLGGAAAAWPFEVGAQQAAVPVIGFLDGASANGKAVPIAAFRQGLREAGYVEGQNVAIEFRFAENQYDRLRAMAADLVRLKVSMIAAFGTPAVLAAKATTSTIPIVFVTGDDPIKIGFAASLNRPGGNLTGVTTLASEVGPKRLELLHELLPTATIIAVLVNPTNANAETQWEDLQAAAPALGVQLHVLHASNENDLNTAFATLLERQARALIVATDSFMIIQIKQIAALSVRYAVPTIFQFREFAAAGGLMSYGGSATDTNRLAGIYTGRVLKGEKPFDLPVQQSTKVELIINLKTARAIGITIPNTLLALADVVIE